MALSTKNEFHVFINDKHRESVLRGLFLNFYEIDGQERLVFDTSRVWCSKLSGLCKLFPRSKVLCCVRSVAWIIDSFERLYHANALQPSKIYAPESIHSVYSRVEQLTGPAGIVRMPYDALQEAFLGPNSDRLLVIQYESLARSPRSTMSSIYEFLGEPQFQHDYSNVSFEADEFDRFSGAPGLHRVSKEVRYVERPTILPGDVFRKLDKPLSFWKDASKNLRNARVI